MLIPQNGTRYSQTATNATSAVATQTGIAGSVMYITDITGSSDLASATILVKDGSTVIWQDLVKTGSYTMNFMTPLAGTRGNNISVTVNGTAACNANVSGFYL